jgi:hypothetical protein
MQRLTLLCTAACRYLQARSSISLSQLLRGLSALQRQQLLQLQLAHWEHAAELSAAVEQELQVHGRSQSQEEKLSDAVLDYSSATFCTWLLNGQRATKSKPWVSCCACCCGAWDTDRQ